MLALVNIGALSLGAPSTCVDTVLENGWKQTGGCLGSGSLEPVHNLNCMMPIPMGAYMSLHVILAHTHHS